MLLSGIILVALTAVSVPIERQLIVLPGENRLRTSYPVQMGKVAAPAQHKKYTLVQNRSAVRVCVRVGIDRMYYMDPFSDITLTLPPPSGRRDSSLVDIAFASFDTIDEEVREVTFVATAVRWGSTVQWSSSTRDLVNRQSPLQTRSLKLPTLSPFQRERDDFGLLSDILGNASRMQNKESVDRPVFWSSTLIGISVNGYRVARSGSLTVRTGTKRWLIDEAGATYKWIAPGSFTRGTYDPRSPNRQIEVSAGFWCALTELTNAQACYWLQLPIPEGPAADFPRSELSFDDCQDLLTKVRQSTACAYGLLTESQWEYVAQAGNLRPYGRNADVKQLGWTNVNAKGVLHPVASLLPSDWGIYDMHGNVQEWCADWFDNPPPFGLDPTGPSDGNKRVIRGGSAMLPPAFATTGSRNASWPDLRLEMTGTRLRIKPRKF